MEDVILQRVQGGKCSLGRDDVTDSAKEKGIFREKREVTDRARREGKVGARRNVTDTARGKGVVRERRDVTDSEGGKRSVGRDVMFQTVQGERVRSGEK